MAKWGIVCTEVEILTACVHENIVDIYGVFGHVSAGKSVTKLDDWMSMDFVIMLEYASAGDMQKEIERFGDQYMPESGAKYYLKQICHGLQYLHSKRVRHNDIHAHNILLKYNPDQTKKCLIADFGISRILDPNEEYPANIFQRDVSQVCHLGYLMMTEGKSVFSPAKKVELLSKDAQRVIECVNYEAPFTVRELLQFPFFHHDGFPPLMPKPPSPLLTHRDSRKIGYLPPARHVSQESAGPVASTSRVRSLPPRAGRKWGFHLLRTRGHRFPGGSDGRNGRLAAGPTTPVSYPPDGTSGQLFPAIPSS